MGEGGDSGLGTRGPASFGNHSGELGVPALLLCGFTSQLVEVAPIHSSEELKALPNQSQNFWDSVGCQIGIRDDCASK